MAYGYIQAQRFKSKIISHLVRRHGKYSINHGKLNKIKDKRPTHRREKNFHNVGKVFFFFRKRGNSDYFPTCAVNGGAVKEIAIYEDYGVLNGLNDGALGGSNFDVWKMHRRESILLPALNSLNRPDLRIHSAVKARRYLDYVLYTWI